MVPKLKTNNMEIRSEDLQRIEREPIDFISFDGLFNEDKVSKITFIDAKTGDARLSPREKSIKNAVEKGEVYFEEFRIET